MPSSYEPKHKFKIGRSGVSNYEAAIEDQEALLSSPPEPFRGNQSPPGSISAFFYRYRHGIRAIPPVLAGSLWLSMMTYFLVYYLTLPKVDGNLPRIGLAYSTFPYISCVGATRLVYFRTFAVATATLVSTAFFLDFWIGRTVHPGRWFRLAKFLCGAVSCVFLVLLSIESVNSSNRLHLIFTSIQIWSMGSAKLMDYLLNYSMRKHDRTNKHLLFTKLWKKCVGLVAAPASVVTLLGIYGCAMPVGLLPSTATCWKLSTFSAPTEWILSLCWVFYLFAVGYDLYHAEAVREHIVAKSSQGSSTGRLLPLRLMNVIGNSADPTSRGTLLPANQVIWKAPDEATEYVSIYTQGAADRGHDEDPLVTGRDFV